MKCEKCHQEIHDQAKFCPFCGWQVIVKKKVNKKSTANNTNIIDNDYSDKSRMLFFVAFFGFDIVLSTILSYLQISNLWVFGVSAILYIGAIILATRGIRYARTLSKKGLEASGLIVSIIMITSSCLMMYINMSSLINYISVIG